MPSGSCLQLLNGSACTLVGEASGGLASDAVIVDAYFQAIQQQCQPFIITYQFFLDTLFFYTNAGKSEMGGKINMPRRTACVCTCPRRAWQERAFYNTRANGVPHWGRNETLFRNVLMPTPGRLSHPLSSPPISDPIFNVYILCFW